MAVTPSVEARLFREPLAEGVATICEPFTEMTVTDVGIRAAASDAAIAVVTFKVRRIYQPRRTAKSG